MSEFQAFTIQEFCAAEKISRAFFYKLQGQGKAPRTYLIGSNRRISREAWLAWRTEHCDCPCGRGDEQCPDASGRPLCAASKS